MKATKCTTALCHKKEAIKGFFIKSRPFAVTAHQHSHKIRGIVLRAEIALTTLVTHKKRWEQSKSLS